MEKPSVDALEKRRKRLMQELLANMDFLIGSVSSKGLKCEAYNLTTKVNGVTRSKHIPKDRVTITRRATQKHQRIKELLKEISQANGELLRAGEKPNHYDIF